MTGFIHGELNWIDRADTVVGAVERMRRAVGGHPWASTGLDVVSRDPACVMSTQCLARTRDADRTGTPATTPGTGQGTLHLVADIQLHEREELAAELGFTGADASALTDTDLLRHAYRRWGLGFAGRILGDGAFALWDPGARRFLCWRDPAGIRPLYYHHRRGQRFVFSSDLQSMVAHPAVGATLDTAYAKALLINGQFLHPERSLVEGVRKLPAAHLLVADDGGTRLVRYWDPRAIAERATPEDRAVEDRECAEELRRLLQLAIRSRLPGSADGVGAHLSGGLDSSSVAVTAARLVNDRGRPLIGYSWAPPRELCPLMDRDERDLVEATARHGDIPVRYTVLEPSDVVDVSCRDIALRPRSMLTFEVATSRTTVRDGVRTLLSGWGGDELLAFNGRGYFADLARRGHLATVQRELRLRATLHGGTMRGAWKSRVLLPLLPHPPRRFRRHDAGALPDELRPEFVDALSDVEPLEHTPSRERPGVHRMQIELLEYGHLQHRTESWAAHGASIGLTYAFPLLDRRVIEFALSLPGAMYFREGWKRWLYRVAMEGTLPDAVRWNRDKYDAAAGQHLDAVAAEANPSYRERLIERKDNPFVDIDVLVAELDRKEAGLPATTPSNAPSRSSIGRADWLPFTALRLG